MARGIDMSLCGPIAESLGVSRNDIKRAVESFFSVISSDASSLPFDNRRKIYSRDCFDRFSTVRNIPCIGRIGPVYSRYLKWRANESRCLGMVSRGSVRIGRTRGEIENIAAEALSGATPSIPPKPKGSDLFERVWLVGPGGRRSAWQVIPK